MTEYTYTKRGLQKLGFKVHKRLGERDVILTGHGYAIRIAAGFHLEGRYPPYNKIDDCIYAAIVAAEHLPVSWHHASRRCSQPGRWIGENYRITVTPEEELTGIEHDIWSVMYSCAHAGHHITDLIEEW